MVIAADVQFVLPDPTVSTFVTPTTMADPAFEVEMLFTPASSGVLAAHGALGVQLADGGRVRIDQQNREPSPKPPMSPEASNHQRRESSVRIRAPRIGSAHRAVILSDRVGRSTRVITL